MTHAIGSTRASTGAGCATVLQMGEVRSTCSCRAWSCSGVASLFRRAVMQMPEYPGLPFALSPVKKERTSGALA
ncbi:MAG: hypothetical protein C4290_15295 [Chloroflexota bacterium]